MSEVLPANDGYDERRNENLYKIFWESCCYYGVEPCSEYAVVIMAKLLKRNANTAMSQACHQRLKQVLDDTAAKHAKDFDTVFESLRLRKVEYSHQVPGLLSMKHLLSAGEQNKIAKLFPKCTVDVCVAKAPNICSLNGYVKCPAHYQNIFRHFLHREETTYKSSTTFREGDGVWYQIFGFDTMHLRDYEKYGDRVYGSKQPCDEYIKDILRRTKRYVLAAGITAREETNAIAEGREFDSDVCYGEDDDEE